MKGIGIVILLVIIGFLFIENRNLENRINFNIDMIDEKNKQIDKLNLENYGYELILKKKENKIGFCRISRGAVAQKALEYGATLKDLNEIVDIYDLVCGENG
jgi:hypothetical protein